MIKNSMVLGDNQWFYGRIINYDPSTKCYRVWYSADNAHEWINLAEDIVIVSCQHVMVSSRSKSAGTWPALKYWISPKAALVLANIKYFRASGVYVEYFSERGKADFSFVSEDLIQELNENTVPKRPSPKLTVLMEKVEEDKKMKNDIVHDLITLTESALFAKGCNKFFWVGLRVKVMLNPDLENTAETSML